MAVVVVEEDWRGSRGIADHKVGDSRGRVSALQEQEGALGSSFINTTIVEIGIPFVARTLGAEPILFVPRTSEHRSTVGLGAGGFAQVARQNVTDARQRVSWVDRFAGQNLCAGEPLLVVVGVKLGGDPDLSQVCQAGGVVGFGFRLNHSRKQQACEHRDEGDHREQFNQGECARRASMWRWDAVGVGAKGWA